MTMDYFERCGAHDAELAARGYDAEQIGNAKSWVSKIGNRRFDDVVCNNGTITPLFEDDFDGECCRVLCLLMMGAGELFGAGA